MSGANAQYDPQSRFDCSVSCTTPGRLDVAAQVRSVGWERAVENAKIPAPSGAWTGTLVLLALGGRFQRVLLANGRPPGRTIIYCVERQ